MRDHRSQIVRTQDVAGAIVIAIVAVSPFPFGSVSTVAIALLLIAAAAAVAIFALCAPASPSPGLIGAGVLVVLVAYGAVVYLQTVPRDLTDPLVHPIWREAGQLLGRQLTATASIAREQPLFAVGTPLLTVLLFVAGYFCGADEANGPRLLAAIAWITGCYAIFAILHFAFAPTLVLWQEKTAYLGSLTGTFTNRNAAGAYFASGAAVWFALALRTIALDPPSSESGHARRRRRRRRSVAARVKKAGVPLVFFGICIVALLLSGSRAATACGAVGLGVIFFTEFRRAMSRRNRNLLLLLGAISAVAIIYTAASGSVGERLQTEGFQDGGRMEAYAQILKMIEDFPLLGSGLGSFQWSFTAYRSAQISGWGIWDKAHSVMLEIGSEGGILLAAVVLVAWMTILVVLGRATVKARPSALVPAAFAVVVIALLHSTIDFSLQIPAYAITVAALAGAGFASARKQDEAQGAEPH